MNRRCKSMLYCALLLTSGCTPKEYDSTNRPAREPANPRDSRAANVNETDPTQDGQQATKDRLVEKSKETWDLARQWAAQSKDEFLVEAKQRLSEMDEKIKVWDAKADSMSLDAKARWQEERKALLQRRKEWQAQLDKAKDASSDAWPEMKSGVKQAWNDLADAIEKSAARFREKYNESGDHPESGKE